MSEKLPENNEMKIEKKGSFFETDAEGFLINPASAEKIQEKWKPILDDIVDWHRETFGDSLENIYVRGSVARGEAVKGVSDVDTFAYVNLSPEEINERSEEIKNARIKIAKKYPFSDGVEIIIMPIEKSKNRGKTVLLNQSLCIHGKPVDVSRLKPGKDMALHAPNIDKRIASIDKFLKGDHSDKQIKSKCTWAMKGLLRSGCELVMERSGKYTRDLYPCYEVFSEYYPEKEPEMRRVLYLALNPTSSKEELGRIMHDFGGWLQKEVNKHF